MRRLICAAALAAAACTPGPAGEAAGEARVWASAEACAEVLAGGGRLAREPGQLRVGSWNLRWFPHGCPPDSRCPERATDVEWLACGITWMQVDALAVQEVLKTPAARRGLEALTGRLDALSGGRWQSDLQDCGDAESQSVGFVWDASRVGLDQTRDLWELNGDRRAGPRDACAARLRPGRHARLTTAAGLELSLIALHLDSGRRALDWSRRRTALARLADSRLPGLAGGGAAAIALGDFNSMGRGDPPAVEPADEVALLGRELAGRFRSAPADRRCTSYYAPGSGRHAASSLDHVFPSPALAGAAAEARVSGYCAALGCPETIRGSMPAAYRRLSDHCPVLLDIAVVAYQRGEAP